MSEGYVQIPTDSTGKKVGTIEASIGGNTVEMEPMLLVDSGSYATITPVLREQIPTVLTSTGFLKVSVQETGSLNYAPNIPNPIGVTGSLTGSINNWPSIYIVGPHGITGSVSITGSVTQGTIPWNVTGSVIVSSITPIGITGSISITGSGIGNSVAVTGSVYQAGAWTINPVGVTGSGFTGSVNQSGQWNINATGSGVNNSIVVTGSVYQSSIPWNITGSVIQIGLYQLY